MAAGFLHNCAIRIDGKVYCWGYNGNGQLGIGTTTSQSTLADATAVTFPGVTDPAILPVEIVAGGYHTCARLSNGQVFCWGYNDFGQLGDGSLTTRTSPVAVNLGAGNFARSIAGGSDHTCAVLSNGTARCWGWNSNGQLGNNSLVTSPTPVPVAVTTAGGTLGGLVSISCGGYHSCALTVQGTVYCWGYGLPSGQSSSGNVTRATQVPSLSSVVELSTGGAFTCAMVTGGAVSCWREGGYGQLGNGLTANSVTPQNVLLSTPGFGSRAIHIGSGNNSACAVMDSGRLECWGLNNYGQLGNIFLSGGSSPWPTMVVNSVGTPITGVVSVAAVGYLHNCAVDNSNGGVSCWGYNGNGQLGDGTTTSRNYAQTVNTPPLAFGSFPVIYYITTSLQGGPMLASGDQHSCMLAESIGVSSSMRNVRCWGANGFGQRGDGTLNNRSYAAAVAGATFDTVAIAAGTSHTCLLNNAGAVSCWGRNESRQLGTSSSANQVAPTAVVGLTLPAVAITAGEAHTCALLSDSSVRCWGRNRWPGYAPYRYGTIGNNDSNPANEVFATPQIVRDASTGATLVGVATIVAGKQHTCAIMSNGGVRCWGLNSMGQLNGNPESADQIAPGMPLPNVTAMSLAGGAFHTCAALADGTVKCWGDDAYGQLGNFVSANQFEPVRVSNTGTYMINTGTPLTNVVSLSSNFMTTCALLADSTVSCWGENGFLQAGGATTASLTSAFPVTHPAGETGNFRGAFAISSGSHMSCALRGNGATFCWGDPSLGALGSSGTFSTNVPRAVSFF